MYSVKEIFYSLQGEGQRVGRPAIFCRFSGCNFWNGREEDRDSAICNFCDTDFVGTNGTFGGKYKNEKTLAESIFSLWPIAKQSKYVVFTGGEPLLQLDSKLVNELHKIGFEVAVETNGSIAPGFNIDWICVSPKQTVENIKLTSGNEIKLVYPQLLLHPKSFEVLEFQHYYIQPMHTQSETQNIKNIQKSVDFCLANPKWKLSLQTHKILKLR